MSSPIPDSHPDDADLDGAVARALAALGRAREVRPLALFLSATAPSVLAGRLSAPGRQALADLPGVPARWRAAELHWGRLGSAPIWMLEDPIDEPLGARREPHWSAGFPCWLAASAGAAFLVHTSAGSSLPRAAAERERGADVPAGSIALVRDHLNLSGSTPLLGLGESQLGPMFPDQTALHDRGLRALAARHADALGERCEEVVVACTAGPSLDTPAERRFYARAGADVAVQGLAAPLLAAAHAGLAVLAVVAVTDAGEGSVDLAGILEQVQRTAPVLEDLLERVAHDLPALTGAAREGARTGR